ncbi:MAG: hypothetical protein AAGD11_12335 [Planctomycetota bacterium]
MSSDDRNTEQWNACSGGELTKLVGRLDARQRSAQRKQVLGTALVSTGVFACVVLALGTFMDGGSSQQYGGIACSVCRQHLADYQLHLLGESKFEDGEMLASVKTHLEKCTFCRGKFNAMYPDQQIGSIGQSRQAMLIALQPAFAYKHATRLY